MKTDKGKQTSETGRESVNILTSLMLSLSVSFSAAPGAVMLLCFSM